jgi:hypothetical protein
MTKKTPPARVVPYIDTILSQEFSIYTATRSPFFIPARIKCLARFSALCWSNWYEYSSPFQIIAVFEESIPAELIKASPNRRCGIFIIGLIFMPV